MPRIGHDFSPPAAAVRAQPNTAARIVRRAGVLTRAAGTLALLTLVFMTQAGCAAGIQWRGYVYEPVHSDAVRDGRPMFVYFRHWAVIECTKFEEQVLKDPRVRTASNDFYCVPLQIDWDRALADKWGIADPPGVVLLSPDERLLGRVSGEITADKLLDEMARARKASGPASQPASRHANSK